MQFLHFLLSNKIKSGLEFRSSWSGGTGARPRWDYNLNLQILGNETVMSKYLECPKNRVLSSKVLKN